LICDNQLYSGLVKRILLTFRIEHLRDLVLTWLSCDVILIVVYIMSDDVYGLGVEEI